MRSESRDDALSEEEAAPSSETRPSTLPVKRALRALEADVASSRGFDAALAILLRSMCEQTDWIVGQAWTRRLRDAMLECAPAWHATTPGFESFRAATLAYAFERGGGVPGRVWDRREHAWIEELSLEPNFRRRAEAKAAGLRTGLFVPVVVDRQVVAVLEFLSDRRRTPDATVLELVRDAASRIGSLLQRHRMQEESDLLHATLEQTAEAVVITTAEPDPVIVFASAAFERLSGWTRADVVGRRLLDVVGVAGDPSSVGHLRKAMRERIEFFGEIETTRTNAPPFPCEWSLSVVTRTEGRLHSITETGEPGLVLREPSPAASAIDAPTVHFLLLLRDMSALIQEQRHRARLADSLRRAVVEWQRTFDSIETPIWILDVEGRVVRLNGAARLLTEHSYRTVLGAHIGMLGVGEPWGTCADLARRVAESRAPAAVQVRDECSRTTWDLSAAVVEGGRSVVADVPPRVLVIARDITRLVTLQESLRRNETMATMGAIVAGVAHEVRNPLFGISATIDALELRLAGDSRYREYTKVLRAEVSRLTNLMAELLEYGRPARLDLRFAALGQVFEEASRGATALARLAGVPIKCHVAPDVPKVRIDAARITQVIRNLTENAIQHSPRGAPVHVTATVGPCRKAVVCAVRDHGPGFRDEDLVHIFEPFFTRRRGGTGLGLSLVWRIVEEHGGAVAASNAPDGGAVVTVTLPSAATSAISDGSTLRSRRRRMTSSATT